MIRGSLALDARSVEDVIAVAAVAFDVDAAELVGDARPRHIVPYRQMAMAAARALGHSFPVIGEAFGGRDHTTVIHACRRVAARPEWQQRADAIAAHVSQTPGRLF